MAKISSTDSLELEQDLESDRVSWRVQRVAWSAMLLIVLAAIAGLFGSGPLSGSSAQLADGSLLTKYPRFARSFRSSRLVIEVTPVTPASQEISLSLPHRYLDNFQVEQITPQPVQTFSDPDQVRFVFSHNHTNKPLLVTIDLLAKNFGLLRGEVGIDATHTLSFWQLFYP